MLQRIGVFLIIFISFLPVCVNAQYSADSTLNAQISDAVSLMDSGDYLKADGAFRKLLNSKKKLPDDVAFFYGKTLYQLSNFGKSQNFLKKYIELKGKEGTYYDEANKLLNRLNPDFCNKCEGTGFKVVKIDCEKCSGVGHTEVDCPFCSGKGINKCRTCGGDGVLKQTGKMGQMTFQNCPPCGGNGHTTCDACKGTKRYQKQCDVCSGKGKVDKKVVCNHQ